MKLDAAAHAAEHAMTLVDLAAVEHQLPVGMWDAIHLITACAWAYRESARAQLYASDDDYESFVAAYPHFSAYADIVNLEIATRPT